MFEIQRLKISHKMAYLLIDQETTLPSLYPLLYCINRLHFKSLGTQRSCLLHIRKFYEYWYNKTGHTFCYTINQSNKELFFLTHEVDLFHTYLLDQHMNQTSSVKTSIASLAAIALDVCMFFEFIINMVLRHQDTHRELNRLQDLKYRLRSLIRKRAVNLTFRSFDNFTESLIRQIIQPNTPSNPNPINPFRTQALQVRNYLIIDLMLKYGLRVGELLSLEVGSIQKGVTAPLLTIYSSRSHDPRIDPPAIKNIHSIRVLSITEQDYKNIQMYIKKYRDSDSDSGFLFLSDAKKQNSPLTYRAVYAIFLKVDQVINDRFKKNTCDHRLLSMPKFTPHTARHTWAYRTLKEIYQAAEAQYWQKAKINGLQFSIQGLMEDSKSKLLSLGGWSSKSRMPDLYAKRFISENANTANLKRLEQEVLTVDFSADGE